MIEVLTALKSARDTAIGKIVSIDNNASWLLYIMYSVPHIIVDLPPLSAVRSIQSSPGKDISGIVSTISLSTDAMKQLEAAGLDEAYLLAQRDVDKLAVAVYTLYLYGRR